jgi:D-xylose transport system substrate-binding protein
VLFTPIKKIYLLMKNSFFSILFILLANISVMQGCKQQPPKIGILIHSYDDKDKDYLVEDLKKKGTEVLLREADSDPGKQLLQAREMLNNGAKALIIVSINQDVSAKIMDFAHKENVKVIAYDRLIDGCQLDYYVSANSLDYYVSTNSKKIGELQARYMTSISPHGTYALICGSRYDNNSMRFFNGQMNVLQPYMENGDIQVVYSEFTDDWSAAQGSFHTNQILDKYPDITAIIAGSDEIANGVLATLKERGLEGKVLVAGQNAELDNIRAIISGAQTCTILKPLKEMAEATAEIAASTVFDRPITINFTTESNGKALIKSVMIDATVVNKNNIETTILATGYYTTAQINQ